MQSYFGKDTDFSKLSGTMGNAAALGVRGEIQGDVIQDQAKKRAQMRLMQGESMKDQGQAAGSSAVTNGFINAGVSAISGGLQGGFSEGGIFNKGLNNGDPGTFGDGLGTGNLDYSWNANPKNYEPGSISSPGWSWDDL